MTSVSSTPHNELEREAPSPTPTDRPTYRLAASNIGWKAADDEAAYELMLACHCQDLEVAPGRIVEDKPYDHPEAATAFAETMDRRWGLKICSLQSLWYRETGSIYNDKDRPRLLATTLKALTFADRMDCRNLVFGCPRQRSVPRGADPAIGREFFTALGDAAAALGSRIAIEPNPTIYATNFLNTTEEAALFIRELGTPGLRINLDVGTLIANDESVEALEPLMPLVSHVHISEPDLVPLKPRPLHRKLRDVLVATGYDGYVSLEMAPTDFRLWRESLTLMAEVFG